MKDVFTLFIPQSEGQNVSRRVDKKVANASDTELFKIFKVPQVAEMKGIEEIEDLLQVKSTAGGRTIRGNRPQIGVPGTVVMTALTSRNC
ncbi:hypothetical protein G9A89_003789 [Geosiphon pyriformis]|nr:hypothetical protein G9A89_003789 [Geosiphon pyriformis]